MGNDDNDDVSDHADDVDIRSLTHSLTHSLVCLCAGSFGLCLRLKAAKKEKETMRPVR